MRTFLLLSLVLAIAQCQDYTCPKGKSKPKKIMLSPGDSYTFNGNNDGDSYFPKTKCAAIYKAHKKCKDGIRVSCEGFDLPNRDASRCRKGDRLILGKKAYCQTNSPDPITLRGKAAKKGLRVMFISDKKSQGDGPVCTAECLDGAAATTTAPTTTSGSPTSGPATTTSGSGVTSGPNPGGPAEERTLTLTYTWSQEPSGAERSALVAIPATTAGQKVPVVFHLHGNGGQGNTRPFGSFLGDDCIIVAPNGYERSWNVYSEKSKADDVQFILDLITKIGEEIPAADMNNVNIAGTSNGAALTYQLLINTGADRPFHRAFPMVSSLIGPQYNNDQFWKFSVSAAAGSANNFDTSVVPAFSSTFEYAHFHGTNDGAIKYEGQNPGPAFLNNAEVISAQKTDYVWAKAMGYTGAQIPDSDGVSVGTTAKPTEEYKYLDGRCRHYKLIDEGHGTGPSHPIVQNVVREMILGSA